MEVIEYSTMVNIAKAVKAHVTSLEVSRANMMEMDKLIQHVTKGKLHQQTAAHVMSLYCYHVAKRLMEEEERFLFTTTYKVEEIKPRDVLKSEMESLLNSYNVLKSETEKLLKSEKGGDVTSAADDVHLDVEFEDEARPRWNAMHLKHVREVITQALITHKTCLELTYVWEESTAERIIPMLNALGFKVEAKAKSAQSSRKYIVTWEVTE